MDENYEMSQAMSDEQRFQELRQRINEKARNLIKWGTTEGRKHRGVVIAVLAVSIAIIIAIEVYSYIKNDFWEVNVSLLAFIAGFLVTDRIMVMILRHYLTSMEGSTTPPRHYRALKRLIITHKFRQLIPLTAAITCGYFVQFGTVSWPTEYLFGYSLVIGAFLGSLSRNWFLDDDFRFDVEELEDMVHQESAA